MNLFINLKKVLKTKIPYDHKQTGIKTSFKVILLFSVFYFAVFEFEDSYKGIVEYLFIVISLFSSYLFCSFLFYKYINRFNKDLEPDVGLLLIGFLIIYSLCMGLLYPIKQYFWDIKKGWFLKYYFRHLPYAFLIYALYLYRMYKNSHITMLIEKLNTNLENKGKKTFSKSDENSYSLKFILDNISHSIKFSKIIHITVNGHYLDINFRSEGKTKEICIRKSLKDIIKELPDNHFIKIHRSHIINSDYASMIEKKGRNYFVKLTGVETSLPISRSNISYVISRLENCI